MHRRGFYQAFSLGCVHGLYRVPPCRDTTALMCLSVLAVGRVRRVLCFLPLDRDDGRDDAEWDADPGSPVSKNYYHPLLVGGFLLLIITGAKI